jgi:hypothetical protein
MNGGRTAEVFSCMAEIQKCLRFASIDVLQGGDQSTLSSGAGSRSQNGVLIAIVGTSL